VFAERRREMVDRQLRSRGIRDPRVLAAIEKVPRHLFVPPELREEAYNDQPLPIGAEQTISQPYMVASMTELLELAAGDRALEIGAGSGYQTAILAELTAEVHTVEKHPGLAAAAAERLARLGYANAHVHTGDGTLGWPEAAPYTAILVTAAAPFLPPPLVQQLADGGRLVLPLGAADTQAVVRVRRRGRDIATESLYACRFVPLLGRYGWREEDPRG
jgi:protein-L-isoaspartate(D-aspartate) O-methyltransferase